MSNGDEATIKHKRKLIMITSKEEDHLIQQLGPIFTWISVLKGSMYNKQWTRREVNQAPGQTFPRIGIRQESGLSLKTSSKVVTQLPHAQPIYHFLSPLPILQ